MTSAADMLSFAEISCLLPYVPIRIDGDPSKLVGKPTGGFAISVSNDGKSFSNDSLFLVYDSKCMDCSRDGKGICSWKVLIAFCGPVALSVWSSKMGSNVAPFACATSLYAKHTFRSTAACNLPEL